MNIDSNEELFQVLKEYDKLHFCMLVILYYHKNINKIIDTNQFSAFGKCYFHSLLVCIILTKN